MLAFASAGCVGSVEGDGRNDEPAPRDTPGTAGPRPGAGGPTSSDPPPAMPAPGAMTAPAPGGTVVALPTETDGNALDAEKIFECKDPGRTASVPRVWRLSGAQYGNVVKSA